MYTYLSYSINKVLRTGLYIGYNKGISVLQVLDTYNRFFTNKVKYKFTKEKKGIIIRSVADNRKFLKLSNWKPKYSNLLKIIKSYYK